MKFQIRKLSKYPFEVLESDKIIAEFSNSNDVQGELDYLGYLDARVENVKGVRVYYKSKKDAVYVSARW